MRPASFLARSLGVLIVSLLALTLTLTGCGAGDDTAKAPDRRPPTVVKEATLKLGDPIPTPAGPVVLKILNAGNPNQGKHLELDLETLESMGTVKYQVDDREGIGKMVTFSGPLLETVLDYAGVDWEKKRTIEASARNDYNIGIPTQHLKEYPLMLATRMDGKTMNLGTLGPTRIVYPNVDYKIDATLAPYWIWSMDSLAVA